MELGIWFGVLQTREQIHIPRLQKNMELGIRFGVLQTREQIHIPRLQKSIHSKLLMHHCVWNMIAKRPTLKKKKKG